MPPPPRAGVMHGTAWAETDVRGHTAMLFLSLGVISGATSSHYTARSADVGKYLTCRRITHVRALTPTLVATSAGVRVTR